LLGKWKSAPDRAREGDECPAGLVKGMSAPGRAREGDG